MILTAWDVDDESLISFEDEDFYYFEPICEARDVDRFLDAAIEGRVRVLQGRFRGAVLVSDGECHEEVGAWWDDLGPISTSWLPLPGWRRRATVVDYAPYRA